MMHAFADAKNVSHYSAMIVQMRDLIIFLCLSAQHIVLAVEAPTLKVQVAFGTNSCLLRIENGTIRLRCTSWAALGIIEVNFILPSLAQTVAV